MNTTDRVPLGQHALLLKLGKLPPVVYGGEDLPQAQERQTDEYDGPNHTQDQAQDIHMGGTLSLLLSAQVNLTLSIIAVHILKLALIFVIVNAKVLVLSLVLCDNRRNSCKLEKTGKGKPKPFRERINDLVKNFKNMPYKVSSVGI